MPNFNNTNTEQYSCFKKGVYGSLFDKMQHSLHRQYTNSKRIYNKEDFYSFFSKKRRNKYTEARLKKELQVTPRFFPLENKREESECIFTKKSGKLTVFSKSY